MKANIFLLIASLMISADVFAQPAVDFQVSMPSTQIENSDSIDQLRNQLNEKNNEIDRLNRILKTPTISKVKFIKANVLSNNAYFYIRTNQYGKIRASITDQNKVPVSGGTYEGYGQFHKLSFTGLSPGQNYDLIITAPNAGGDMYDVSYDIINDLEDQRIYSEKGFTTTQNKNENLFFGFKEEPVTVRQDSIALSVITNQEIQIAITCEKKIPKKTHGVPCSIKDHGNISADEVGLPIISEAKYKTYKAGDIFLIDNLEPDSEYVFYAKAVSSNGSSSNIVIPNTYRTPESPQKLDFNGPLNIAFGQNDLSISWKAIGITENSKAKVVLELGPGSSVSEDATFDSNTGNWTAKISSAASSFVGAKNDLKDEKNSSNYRPLLMAMMSEDQNYNNPVKREISISMSGSGNKLDTSAKKNIQEVVNIIAPQGRKEKIYQLINAGLPLLLSIFAF